ncbi:hypothetical protein QYM36_006302, partial [Artemia franciscana]
MPILYSVIARGKIVLARFATCSGNFGEVADQILPKIDSADASKLTYGLGEYMCHYIVEDKVTYLCITDTFLPIVNRHVATQIRFGKPYLVANTTLVFTIVDFHMASQVKLVSKFLLAYFAYIQFFVIGKTEMPLQIWFIG